MYIKNYPAMKVGDFLIISDLHLGITKELYENGVRIPSQVNSLSEKINKLKKITKTKKLLLLGDVKHQVPRTSWQEMKEVPEFFSLINYKNVVITKGNHDGFIERLVPDNVKVRKSFSYKDYIFTHGHRKINSSKKKIVIGHNHAYVKFQDKIGAIYMIPVWLRGFIGSKEVTIMPSFNDLSGGVAVNQKGFEFSGPIAKNLSKNSTKAYMMDGTDLGYLNHLEVNPR